MIPNNLQFVDKGKVIAEYPGVAFQGGTIWVDENTTIQNKDYYWTANKPDKVKRYFENREAFPSLSERNKVIAQSPDLNLEGVPYVEVVDKVERLIYSYFIDSVENKKKGHIAFDKHNIKLLVQQVKAAQSKGSFSEEQVKDIIVRVTLAVTGRSLTNDSMDRLTSQILTSLQPNIIVDVIDGKPVMYEQDGKTFYKLK